MSSNEPESTEFDTVLSQRLERLYGPAYADARERILDTVARFESESTRASGKSDASGGPTKRDLWDQRDVVLITYGDQIQSDSSSSMSNLRTFLLNHELDELIRVVHLLPFFPYTSDDGFSVVDYRQVDPLLGDWKDVAALNSTFDLMFDLVLNHCSCASPWLKGYLDGNSLFENFFIEVDPTCDVSGVTRPRSSKLLTKFETGEGAKHIWTTFSADQVDLNFSSPVVLNEMLEILLFYIRNGARIIRLDAIAYLWKEIGTSCIHLPETHEVVKLFRLVIERVAPHVLLLTETNVPHQENISYFGRGDEAHLVYQFSLPPLLLLSMLTGDASSLQQWLANLPAAGPKTNYLNFTASHDGIGVRPLEGLVEPSQIDELAKWVKARDGLVSMRRKPDGTDAPYELNVSYFSGLAISDNESHASTTADHVRRFMTTQGLMLSLRGIPAIYFHSLVGTPNDLDGVRESGHPRRINRHKFDQSELENQLADSASPQAKVFAEYRRLLAIRIKQPAFHPDADQVILDMQEPALLGLLRVSHEPSQTILVLANFSAQSHQVRLDSVLDREIKNDLLDQRPCESAREVTIEPYGLRWLALS
ncbi:MAG: alpha-amylase family glycosyl hydrolase [Planctomycetota bacterium]